MTKAGVLTAHSSCAHIQFYVWASCLVYLGQWGIPWVYSVFCSFVGPFCSRDCIGSVKELVFVCSLVVKGIYVLFDTTISF